MKLYYAPGACSFAPHVCLREAGFPFTLVRMDRKTQTLDDGRRIEDINEKGYVPVLELDNGKRLTEAPAVLQYIADQSPAAGLAPPPGAWERYQLQEWLNFLSSEVHKSFWSFFHDGCEEEKPAMDRAPARRQSVHLFAEVHGGRRVSIDHGQLAAPRRLRPGSMAPAERVPGSLALATERPGRSGSGRPEEAGRIGDGLNLPRHRAIQGQWRRERFGRDRQAIPGALSGFELGEEGLGLEAATAGHIRISSDAISRAFQGSVAPRCAESSLPRC